MTSAQGNPVSAYRIGWKPLHERCRSETEGTPAPSGKSPESRPRASHSLDCIWGVLRQSASIFRPCAGPPRRAASLGFARMQPFLGWHSTLIGWMSTDPRTRQERQVKLCREVTISEFSWLLPPKTSRSLEANSRPAPFQLSPRPHRTRPRFEWPCEEPQPRFRPTRSRFCICPLALACGCSGSAGTQ